MDKADEQPIIVQGDFEAAEDYGTAIACGAMTPTEAFARYRLELLAAQDGLVEALEKIPTAALYALRHRQQQADMDGTFVTISRQALEEVLDAVEAALSAIKGDMS